MSLKRRDLHHCSGLMARDLMLVVEEGEGAEIVEVIAGEVSEVGVVVDVRRPRICKKRKKTTTNTTLIHLDGLY